MSSADRFLFTEESSECIYLHIDRQPREIGYGPRKPGPENRAPPFPDFYLQRIARRDFEDLRKLLGHDQSRGRKDDLPGVFVQEAVQQGLFRKTVYGGPPLYVA